MYDMAKNQGDNKVTIMEKLFGYLIGPFGAMLASGIFASILQSYFTDVLKISLTFLTTLQLVSMFLIVASNLVAGQLIERTKALAGKARPWILVSALTVSVTTVLMFIIPFENQTAKMVWIAIAYNLYYAVAYPIYSTANSTLLSLSTRDTGERSSLAALINVSGLAVMGAGSMIFPMLVSFALKENQSLWFITFLAIGIFSGLTILLQYRFTRERVTEELREKASETATEDGMAGEMPTSEVNDDRKVNENVPLKTQLKALFTEKTFWIIIVFYMGFQWGGALKNGTMTYFCKWVLDNSIMGSADAWGVSQSILSIAGAVPMALAALFVVPLSNKIGKKNLCAIGMVIGVIGGVIAGLGADNLYIAATGVAIKCLGSAPACYLILAMLADEIDFIEKKTGVRSDGLTMSIYGAILSAGSGIMNALFSALLNIFGYDQYADVADGVLAQTASVHGVITFGYIWFETICFALCAVLILFWNVEKKAAER